MLQHRRCRSTTSTANTAPQKFHRIRELILDIIMHTNILDLVPLVRLNYYL